MANRERGEVSLDIKGVTYTLILDIEAMCALEEMFSTPEKDVTCGEVIERGEKGSIRHLRAIWWSCFQRHHPDVTVNEAARFISDLGGLPGLHAKLAEIALATRPDARDLPAKKGRRPQQAQVNGRAGTGGISTSKPVALA